MHTPLLQLLLLPDGGDPARGAGLLPEDSDEDLGTPGVGG